MWHTSTVLVAQTLRNMALEESYLPYFFMTVNSGQYMNDMFKPFEELTKEKKL
jgi:hypothetical protein